MDCTDTSPAANRVGSRPSVFPAAELALVSPSHPARASLEGFIAAVYAHRYGARISYFARQLVALQDRSGRLLAAAGYTPAHTAPLFIEHYLDRPVQEVLSERLRTPVDRAQVVETGNLAAIGVGAARQVIFEMAGLLHRLGRTWAVLTCTRALLNSFHRLEIAPILLACADPSRLPDRGASWGSYYDTHPLVVAVSVPLGVLQLRARSPDAIR
jgi:hypothetical protein